MIKTFSETDYLYLIDQTNKRLIILDKNAKLIAQISFPTLPKIYDINVDENKNLYLLDGQYIYQLYLPEVLPVKLRVNKIPSQMKHLGGYFYTLYLF